jgi:transcriptional regulator with XRE-family HTH domain
MDIGLLVKQYRQANSLTLREFAAKCGTSHSYIAMLENNKNSKTGEPIVPTIAMLKKISQGMHISVNELIALCDDMPINMDTTADVKLNLQLFSEETSPASEEVLTEEERLLIDLFRQIPEEQQRVFLEMGRVYANSLKKD